MGTHPIFESDFDCLTDSMRFTKALRGGGNWDLIPPEKIPSPNFWNKVIKGTPYEFTQVQLSRKGLHHSWTRHEISKYDSVMRKSIHAHSFQRRASETCRHHHRWHHLCRGDLRILPIRTRSPHGPWRLCFSCFQRCSNQRNSRGPRRRAYQTLPRQKLR